MHDERTLKFLQKIKELGTWNKNYDYSNVVYKGIRNKVVIIDKKYNSKHLIWPEQLKKGIECSMRNVLDSQAYILNRFKEYNKKTSPLIDFYEKQNKFYQVDGSGTIDEITDRIYMTIDNFKND